MDKLAIAITAAIVVGFLTFGLLVELDPAKQWIVEAAALEEKLKKTRLDLSDARNRLELARIALRITRVGRAPQSDSEAQQFLAATVHPDQSCWRSVYLGVIVPMLRNGYITAEDRAKVADAVERCLNE